MPFITIVIGVLLIALGPIAYFVSETESWTPFIPSIFGVVLGICGLLAARPSLRMHAIHAAVVVALLGAVAAGMRSFPNVGKLFKPDEETSRIALGAQLIMTLLCAFYVVQAVRSFVAARKRRAAAG